MTNKTVAIMCLASAVVSAACTQYFFPQIKTVEVQKEVIRNDIQTVTHTVKEPDGTTDITTTTTDHSQVTLTDTKKEFNIVPNWHVSAFADANIKLESPEYGLNVQRRILGPIFIGASLSNKGNVGASLGMEF